MPAHHQDGSQLAAVLSFYSSIVTVNAEGDSLVSDETLEGLGTTGFLLQTLFGSLLKVVSPESINSVRTTPISSPTSPSEHTQSPALSQETGASATMGAAASAVSAHPQYGPPAAVVGQELDGASEKLKPPFKIIMNDGKPELSNVTEEVEEAESSKLTDLLPDAGYFLAGAVSGGVSRTATAPLDRLKVYLLVNTKTRSVATELAKQGRPGVALRNAGGPIVDAIKSLWKTGGIRTFFAGKLVTSYTTALITNC